MSDEKRVAKTDERRRAVRLRVDIPTVITPVPAESIDLPEALGRVYERVLPEKVPAGAATRFAMRDLSTNGAFLEGAPPLPLLARVRLAFELPGHGAVSAIGWTMWRRREACVVPAGDGGTVQLPAGVGVLFEALDLSARMAIARRTRELAVSDDERTNVHWPEGRPTTSGE